MMALLNKMDHSITTLSICRVVRVAPETMTEILEQHPQVARALRISGLVDEATLREWLVNLGRRYAIGTPRTPLLRASRASSGGRPGH